MQITVNPHEIYAKAKSKLLDTQQTCGAAAHAPALGEADTGGGEVARMGCGGSKGPETLFKEGEVTRKGVPARIEIPTGNQAWRAATVGKALDTTVDHAYEVRVDNSGPLMKVVLKKPDSLNTFASFSEYMDNGGDDDDYDNFKKMLPMQAGLPVRTVILGESRTIDGRICETRQYNGGERVLLLQDDHLVDATVVGPPLNAGSHHALTIESGPAQGRRVTADLNEFNHCLQLFGCVADYEAARTSYLNKLIDKLAFVQDAITGNRLNVDDQVNPPDPAARAARLSAMPEPSPGSGLAPNPNHCSLYQLSDSLPPLTLSPPLL